MENSDSHDLPASWATNLVPKNSLTTSIVINHEKQLGLIDTKLIEQHLLSVMVDGFWQACIKWVLASRDKCR